MPKSIFRDVLATNLHTELFIVSSCCVFLLIQSVKYFKKVLRSEIFISTSRGRCIFVLIALLCYFGANKQFIDGETKKAKTQSQVCKH